MTVCLYRNCMADAVIEIPRSCSISIQSEVAVLTFFRLPTMPAVRTIPE